tara:strand:- start:8955 stop:9143 length:189 start_codon:yes stop_codon:yes gene_type:complete
MKSLSKSDLKAIEISVKFLVDDIAEELRSYEIAGMDDAEQTARKVLGDLYVVLNKVRKMNKI